MRGTLQREGIGEWGQLLRADVSMLQAYEAFFPAWIKINLKNIYTIRNQPANFRKRVKASPTTTVRSLSCRVTTALTLSRFGPDRCTNCVVGDADSDAEYAIYRAGMQLPTYHTDCAVWNHFTMESFTSCFECQFRNFRDVEMRCLEMRMRNNTCHACREHAFNDFRLVFSQIVLRFLAALLFI
jgi:hypothetical protein